MKNTFTVRDLPVDERPRERLFKLGAESMASQELMAIILGRGVKGESVISIVNNLFKKFGDLKNISEASIAELSQVKGIGSAKAAQIKAVFELSRRTEEEYGEKQGRRGTVKCPDDAAKIARRKLKYKKREHFLIMSLDTRNHVISTQYISMGSLDSSIVHPREVFKAAISDLANSIILFHNHPSGNPEPSEEDIRLTRRLIEAGQTIGIDVTDHIIISDGSYFSMKEKNLI